MKQFFKIEIDSERIFGLDLLRALAILFVVMGHGNTLLPKEIWRWTSLFVFDGVSIFFVLSGFLIGGILIKVLERDGSGMDVLTNFWIRRWFRTLPNYFLILFVLIFIHYVFTDHFNVFVNKRYFFFAQNLYNPHPGFFPEAWSLSVEEWFYLLIPAGIFFLVHLFKVSPKNAVLSIAVFIIAGVTLFRLYRFITVQVFNFDEWDLIFRKQVFTRLDSIMFGVIGAYIAHYYKDIWLRYKTMLFIVALLIFIITKNIKLLKLEDYGLYKCVLTFSVTSLATVFLLPYLSSIKKGKGKVFKFLTYISLISYSMYLINLSLIQKWIIESIPWPQYTGVGFYLITLIKYSLFMMLTIALSIIIYKYFEIPMTNLRDKIKFRKKRVQAVAVKI